MPASDDFFISAVRLVREKRPKILRRWNASREIQIHTTEKFLIGSQRSVRHAVLFQAGRDGDESAALAGRQDLGEEGGEALGAAVPVLDRAGEVTQVLAVAQEP